MHNNSKETIKELDEIIDKSYKSNFSKKVTQKHV